MKRTYVYFIKGQQHSWAVNIELSPDAVKDMRDDGVELGEMYYCIPDWVVYAGFTPVWMFASDVFHFRNPFRKF